MNRSLEQIIQSIASLPPIDQHWILNQISPAAGNTLRKHHAFTTWYNAQSEKPITAPTQNPQPTISTPAYSQSLAKKAPLYAAIVLEQGQYPWRALFLERYDSTGQIKRSLEQDVMAINPPVKQALFQAWEANISFEDHLEPTHG